MGMRDDRKDDYAFFITPVDPMRILGYADVIKHPMDLGTMSIKVAKGKYRSLEEFTVSKIHFWYFNSVPVPHLLCGSVIQNIIFFAQMNQTTSWLDYTGG